MVQQRLRPIIAIVDIRKDNMYSNCRFFLILGKECNGSCIYCHQGLNDTPYGKVHEPLPDPKKVATYFPKEGGYTLTLYGGEPLLYWDFIVPFVYAIKNRNPQVRLTMVSNGFLLTKDKAKFMNENNIIFGLSHDGYYYQQTRKKDDILQVNPEPFLLIDKKNIAATCSSLSSDFYQIWDYFDEFRVKHNVPIFPVAIQMMKDVENTTAEFLFIKNRKKYEQMLDKVFDNLYHNVMIDYFECYEWMQYKRMIESLGRNLEDKIPGLFCGADTSTIDVDIYGNLYNCHNCCKPFSHISNGIKASEKPFVPSEKCLSCLSYPLCGGLCYVAEQSKKEYMCYTMTEQVKRLIEFLNKAGGNTNV